jgi:hypothetical protein
MGIFLMEILETADPLLDTLARVVDAADFPIYPSTRNAAVIAGHDFWRATSLTIQYTDVDTAIAAKKTLRDRIDTMVNDYRAYNTDFYTAGSDVDYPRTVAPDTQIEILADTYYTAFEDYVTALNDETSGWATKLAAYNAQSAVTTEASARMTRANTAYSAINTAYGYYYNFAKNISDGISNAQWYYNAVFAAYPGFGSNAAFLARIATEQTYLATVIAARGAANAEVVNAGGAYSTAMSDASTLYASLSTLLDQLTTKRTAATSANALLVAACPTFTYARGYDITTLPPLPTLP